MSTTDLVFGTLGLQAGLCRDQPTVRTGRDLRQIASVVGRSNPRCRGEFQSPTDRGEHWRVAPRRWLRSATENRSVACARRCFVPDLIGLRCLWSWLAHFPEPSEPTVAQNIVSVRRRTMRRKHPFQDQLKPPDELASERLRRALATSDALCTLSMTSLARTGMVARVITGFVPCLCETRGPYFTPPEVSPLLQYLPKRTNATSRGRTLRIDPIAITVYTGWPPVMTLL